MNGLNGIIINGKVYEAVKRGSYHCSDCALYQECNDKWLRSMKLLCEPIADKERILFRFSQTLTDKLNRQ